MNVTDMCLISRLDLYCVFEIIMPNAVRYTYYKKHTCKWYRFTFICRRKAEERKRTTTAIICNHHHQHQPHHKQHTQHYSTTHTQRHFPKLHVVAIAFLSTHATYLVLKTSISIQWQMYTRFSIFVCSVVICFDVGLYLQFTATKWCCRWYHNTYT